MQTDLTYPINVGRNIAREAAMTHFLLVSDFELYPNYGLVHKFLEMIGRNDVPLRNKARKVFPMPPFEITADAQVPRNKTELQEMLKIGKAFQLHQKLCRICHEIPNLENWIAANETESMAKYEATISRK